MSEDYQDEEIQRLRESIRRFEDAFIAQASEDVLKTSEEILGSPEVGAALEDYEDVIRGCAARVAGHLIDTDKLLKDVEELKAAFNIGYSAGFEDGKNEQDKEIQLWLD